MQCILLQFRWRKKIATVPNEMTLHVLECTDGTTMPANNSIKDVIGYHVTFNKSDALSDHVTLVYITQLLLTSK